MEGRMEGWKDGGMEGWRDGGKDGRLEGWKIGRMEDWKIGRLEDWKTGRLDGWKIGRLEDWKIGRTEDWKTGRLEDWKIGRLEDLEGWKIWKIGRLEDLEDWKDGRLEDWKDGRLEDWKDGRLEDLEGWKIGWKNAVPQGRAKVAQQFIAGKGRKNGTVPTGTIEPFWLLVSPKRLRGRKDSIDCPIRDGELFKDADPAFRTGLRSPGPCGTVAALGILPSFHRRTHILSTMEKSEEADPAQFHSLGASAHIGSYRPQ
jgi:hypothetical protein